MVTGALSSEPETRMARFRLALLGGFHLQAPDGAQVRLPTRKTQALLAYLGANVGRAFARSALVGILWGEAPEANARASLRQALVDLRKALPFTPPSLLVEERNVALNPVAISVDVDEFERLIAEDTPEALELAASGYRGDLLEGFNLNAPAFEEWLLNERERLRVRAANALETALAHQSESGRIDTALLTAGRLLALDPLRESVHRTLMRLYARKGRWADVARQYQTCLTRLQQDLGVQPEPETTLLHRQLFEQRASRVAVVPSAPMARGRAHLNNLPRPLTSFIGRAREIDEVKRLLGDVRLVTLTGSGGAGKTRLALRVAADVVENYSDGVWLAEFAPIADPALVPKIVASALDVPERPGRDVIEALVNALRPKSLLLVLDNCEHLLAACGDLAVALLRECPQVRLLVTSREGLGVPGETVRRVPSLSLPDARRVLPPEDLVTYEAVRLFVDRATAIAPEFIVTSKNALAVTQVCQRLDGIPLAIELAAAWTKALALEQIAARLDDRFRFLTRGSRTLLPRQQTLRATLDWSYSLLSDQEGTVLRRLAVFAGGWTLEAAEAVCAGGDVEASDILNLLAHLVDKSLVIAETQNGEARYRLLETVRQYGREKALKAGGAEDVRERHANFFLALAEKAAPQLDGAEDLRWMERVEREHDNFRASLEWSLRTGQGETTLRLANALGRFWDRRGYWSEGRQWLEQGLRLSSKASPALRASALFKAGFFAREQADREQAVAKYTESLALYRELGDKEGTAGSLNGLAMVTYRQGDYGRATALLEESLALSRESDNKPGIASSLYYLGICARLQGKYDQAEALLRETLSLSLTLGLTRLSAFTRDHLGLVAYYRGNFDEAKVICEEALAQFQQMEDKFGIVGSLNSLGLVACGQGNYKRAAVLCEEGLALSRELGNLGAKARSLNVLGRVAQSQGDCKQAEELYRKSLTLFGELGERLGVAQSLERLGSLAITSAPERAVRLFAAAESLRQAIDTPLPAAEQSDYDQNTAAARAQLNLKAFTAASAEGRAMTLAQAIQYALAEKPA